MLEFRLDSDGNVLSRFSDGKNTLEENIHFAIRRKLTSIVCVENVSRRVRWIPEFLREIEDMKARYGSSIHIKSGLSAQIVDKNGSLDIPSNVTGIDYLFAKISRFSHDNKLVPHETVQDWLSVGILEKHSIIDDLMSALLATSERYSPLVFGQLFSLLPNIGLSEADIPADQLVRLGTAAAKRGVPIEISERWNCPSPRCLKLFSQAGASFICSTNSRTRRTIGLYSYVNDALETAGLKTSRVKA